jgi:hypothetical protein
MPDLTTMPPRPAAPPATRPTDHPGRRRGRSRAAALVTIAGLVLVVAALWAVAPGVLLRVAPVSLGFEEGAPAAVVAGFNGPAGAYVVGYEHDDYLDVDVAVANAGVVPIVVDGVELGLQAAPLLVPAESTAPGAVAAGESARGAVRLRFDNCEAYHEREAMVVDHVLVHATVLGRTVTERVALDRPLMARSPMLWQCPDRTIERYDDRRSQDGPSGGFRRDVP